jgi:hypothetical protein
MAGRSKVVGVVFSHTSAILMGLFQKVTPARNLKKVFLGYKNGLRNSRRVN